MAPSTVVTSNSNQRFGGPFGVFSTQAATPNTALQRTAALAFSYRSAGERSTGSVTACAPAMRPGTCRAFASRRSAHIRASGLRSLSFWSSGVASRTYQ